MANRIQLGRVVYFLLKNIVFTSLEKQYTEDLVKNQWFSDHLNFVRPAKFERDKISRRKINTHPDLRLVLVKKIQSDRPNRFEEKGGKLFLLLKTGFRDKRKVVQK